MSKAKTVKKAGQRTMAVERLTPETAIAWLRESGENGAAENIQKYLMTLKNDDNIEKKDLSLDISGDKKYWLYATHKVGYIPPKSGPKETETGLLGAGDIDQDMSLKNACVDIKLEQFRVWNYPGGDIIGGVAGGYMHDVLIDFRMKNGTKGSNDSLAFNQSYKVAEKAAAPVSGYPVFIGVGVGRNGIVVDFTTMNVKNPADQKLMAIFESEELKGGLEVAKTFQPAIGQVASLAKGIFKAFEAGHNNQVVQSYSLGLGLESNTTSPRLREGSYVVVQVPLCEESAWTWDDWVFDRKNGKVVSAKDKTKLIEMNYVIFGITKNTEEA